MELSTSLKRGGWCGKSRDIRERTNQTTTPFVAHLPRIQLLLKRPWSGHPKTRSCQETEPYNQGKCDCGGFKPRIMHFCDQRRSYFPFNLSLTNDFNHPSSCPRMDTSSHTASEFTEGDDRLQEWPLVSHLDRRYSCEAAARKSTVSPWLFGNKGLAGQDQRGNISTISTKWGQIHLSYLLGRVFKNWIQSLSSYRTIFYVGTWNYTAANNSMCRRRRWFDMKRTQPDLNTFRRYS